MAANPLPLTLEEFHKRYDGSKPAYEYWYGAAIQKSMPTTLHALVQFFIMLFLNNAGWATASEVRLKVSKEAEPIPDIVAIKGKFNSRYPTTAPDLCIEILSPDDTLPKAFEKAARYLSFGTRQVWIVDPEKRTAWTLSLDNKSLPKWIPPDGSLQIDETAIALPALFAEIDQRLDLTRENSIP